MVEDEMGGSIITERLRRLREEGEREQRKTWRLDKLEAIPLPNSELDERRRAPSSEGERDATFVPVEVDIMTVVNDDGYPRFVVETVGTVADSSAGAFEFMIHKGWIQRKEDAEGMGGVRQAAGFRFRSLVEDASSTPLKAQNYEGGGGGRGGVPKPVGDHTIDCIKHLKAMEVSIPPETIALVRSVICDDRRPWEGKTGQAVKQEVDRVLKGVDYLALHFRLIGPEDFRLRWEKKPKSGSSSGSPPSGQDQPEALVEGRA